jgi:hypothetical protein
MVDLEVFVAAIAVGTNFKRSCIIATRVDTVMEILDVDLDLELGFVFVKQPKQHFTMLESFTS